MINNGANINATDFINSTALMNAAREGHILVVEFLLENDADMEIEDDRGRTALDIARQEGHLEIVRMLEGRGGDANPLSSSPVPGASSPINSLNRDLVEEILYGNIKALEDLLDGNLSVSGASVQ